MTYLLDSTVLIDALNDRNGRPQFLVQLSHQDILLACCAVNVTEIYMGCAQANKPKQTRFCTASNSTQ